MKEEITLSIYKSRKGEFEQFDLLQLSNALSKIVERKIQIVYIPEEDGEYFKIIISD